MRESKFSRDIRWLKEKSVNEDGSLDRSIHVRIHYSLLEFCSDGGRRNMSKNPESITSASAAAGLSLLTHSLASYEQSCLLHGRSDGRADHFHSLKGREALGRSVAGLRSVAIISYGYIPLVLRATAREPGGTSPALPRAISPGAAERMFELQRWKVGRDTRDMGLGWKEMTS